MRTLVGNNFNGIGNTLLTIGQFLVGMLAAFGVVLLLIVALVMSGATNIQIAGKYLNVSDLPIGNWKCVPASTTQARRDQLII